MSRVQIRQLQGLSKLPNHWPVVNWFTKYTAFQTISRANAPWANTKHHFNGDFQVHWVKQLSLEESAADYRPHALPDIPCLCTEGNANGKNNIN